MLTVASLKYGVIFKKAFCDREVFTAFVQDILGIELEIDQVETEKEFSPSIGYVKPRLICLLRINAIALSWMWPRSTLIPTVFRGINLGKFPTK